MNTQVDSAIAVELFPAAEYIIGESGGEGLYQQIPTSKIAGLAGVYFLFYKGKIVYIGSSKCIIRRIIAHKTRFPFDAFHIIRVEDQAERLAREALEIKKHKPIYNVHHNTQPRAKIIKLTIRMPDGLLDKVTKRSTKYNNSVNTQIIHDITYNKWTDADMINFAYWVLGSPRNPPYLLETDEARVKRLFEEFKKVNP